MTAAGGRLAWPLLARASLAALAFGVATDVVLASALGGGGAASLASSLALATPLLVGAGSQLAGSGRVRVPPPALILLAAYVAWSAASVFWATAVDELEVRLRTNFQLLLLVWLAWQILVGEAELRAVLAGFLAGCMALVASAWRSYLAGAALVEGGTRYAAASVDANDMSLTLAVGIPMAGYLALHGHRWWRLAALACLPLSGSAIALSGSRAGALAAALATLLVLAWLGSGSRTWLAVAAALVACGGAVLAARIPPDAWERLFTVQEELASGSIGDRGAIWRAGLQVLAAHPLLGVGAGGFSNSVQPALGTRLVAHNTLLSIAVELGAVGLSLFLLALAALWRGAARAAPDHRHLAWILLVVWLFGSSSLTWEFRKTTWLVLLVAAAVAALPPPRAEGGPG